MTMYAVEASQLGKRYRIGAVERYSTIRDRIAEAPRKVAAALTRGLRGEPPPQRPYVWALRDVELEIEHGQVLGIIGRNGAGKSTLLKILSRVTAPTTGHARIRGRVGSLLEVGTGFHPELTGRENVFVNGTVLGMRKREVEKKFDEIVDFAGVEQFVDTPVKKYSSGMRLRLAFAVAAHLDAEIIFIDEALSVGDATFQRKCFNRMQGVARSGRTVVVVSHQLDVIAGLCDRVLWMDAGSVAASGNSNDVIRQYIAAAEDHLFKLNGRVVLPAQGQNPFGFTPQDLALEVSGRAAGTILCGDSVTFRVSYVATSAIKDFEATLWLKDSYNRRIACLYNKMTASDFDAPPGAHCIECHVPKFPFSSGNYNLDLSFSSGNSPLQNFPDVLPFVVAPGDFFGTGRGTERRGGVLLQQEWTLPTSTPEARVYLERRQGA